MIGVAAEPIPRPRRRPSPRRRRAEIEGSRTNAAPPSPMTKPSRERSNGREAGAGSSFRREKGAKVAEAAHRHRRHRHLASAGHADVGPAQVQPRRATARAWFPLRARREGDRRAGQAQFPLHEGEGGLGIPGLGRAFPKASPSHEINHSAPRPRTSPTRTSARRSHQPESRRASAHDRERAPVRAGGAARKSPPTSRRGRGPDRAGRPCGSAGRRPGTRSRA